MSNLIEVPGMRGKVTITFDMSRGDVQLDSHGNDLRNVVQILLMAVQGAVAEWIQIDSGIVGRKGEKKNGSEENGSTKTDDDHNSGGSSAR